MEFHIPPWKKLARAVEQRHTQRSLVKKDMDSDDETPLRANITYLCACVVLSVNPDSVNLHITKLIDLFMNVLQDNQSIDW